MTVGRVIARILIGVVLFEGALLGWNTWQGVHQTAGEPRLVTLGSGPSSIAIDIVVPNGYADRAAAGHAKPLVPRELRATVGQVIRIHNADSHPVTMGLFYLRPGETLTQRFATPGVNRGSCTLHPGGLFTLRVVGHSAE